MILFIDWLNICSLHSSLTPNVLQYSISYSSELSIHIMAGHIYILGIKYLFSLCLFYVTAL